MKLDSMVLGLAVLAFVGAGCSTVPDDYVDPSGVSFREAAHNIQVWTAPGADLAAYDTLLIAPTEATATPPDEADEVAQFDRIKNQLQGELLAAAIGRGLYANVVMDPRTVAEGARVLELKSTIVEYKPGSPALRFTIGMGAGWPAIMVRGEARADDQSEPVFRYVARRAMEMRAMEFSDERILSGNVRDLALDLTEVLEQVIQKQPQK